MTGSLASYAVTTCAAVFLPLAFLPLRSLSGGAAQARPPQQPWRAIQRRERRCITLKRPPYAQAFKKPWPGMQSPCMIRRNWWPATRRGQ